MLSLLNVGDKVVGVQSLHDDNNGTLFLSIETAPQCVVEPFVYALASYIR